MDIGYDMTCCVCGGPAEQRCGPCGQAGVSVRFCSTEHQRLVWPVHKLVCGPDKANPFKMPQLSAAELQMLSTMRNKPAFAAFYGNRSPAHLARSYGTSTPTLTDVLKAKIPLFRRLPLAAWLQNPTTLSDKALWDIRYMLHLVSESSSFSNTEARSFNPFAYVALVRTVIADGINDFPASRVPETLHRALIVGAATEIAVRKARTSMVDLPADMLATAYEALLGSVALHLTVPDADAAQSELGVMSDTFTELFPYEVDFYYSKHDTKPGHLQIFDLQLVKKVCMCGKH